MVTRQRLKEALSATIDLDRHSSDPGAVVCEDAASGTLRKLLHGLPFTRQWPVATKARRVLDWPSLTEKAIERCFGELYR